MRGLVRTSINRRATRECATRSVRQVALVGPSRGVARQFDLTEKLVWGRAVAPRYPSPLRRVFAPTFLKGRLPHGGAFAGQRVSLRMVPGGAIDVKLWRSPRRPAFAKDASSPVRSPAVPPPTPPNPASDTGLHDNRNVFSTFSLDLSNLKYRQRGKPGPLSRAKIRIPVRIRPTEIFSSTPACILDSSFLRTQVSYSLPKRRIHTREQERYV